MNTLIFYLIITQYTHYTIKLFMVIKVKNYHHIIKSIIIQIQ